MSDHEEESPAAADVAQTLKNKNNKNNKDNNNNNNNNNNNCSYSSRGTFADITRRPSWIWQNSSHYRFFIEDFASANLPIK